MTPFCPNFSNKQVKKEFETLEDMVGENQAYYLWDKYEGDYAKASSEAFAQLRKQVYSRPDAKTPQQFSSSQRMAYIMQQLYPEIELKFVEAIEGGYAGSIDLDAMQALIDMTKSGKDTIPHEYAHYYVEMFSNAPIIKEGIETFGGKEQLVQAVGIRVANMNGEARSWWQKFKDFVKKLFDNKYAKQALLAEITDSFLIRKQLGDTQKVSGVFHQEIPSVDQVRKILQNLANTVTFDEVEHRFTDKKTGNILTSVTGFKEKANYDNYDASLEDQTQAKISQEARNNGTNIHAVLEGVLKGNLDIQRFTDSMSREAIKGLIDVVNHIKQNYDFVASEAVLADPKHGVAGIADLILKDKKTGEYVLMDFKTKLINYNNKKNDKGYLVNEKGSRLRGFLFSTSKKFRLKSEKDGYDFQLSAYKYILQQNGIPISKVGIIPIVYSVDKGKISKAGLSTVFGTNEEANSQMKKEGFYQITQSQQTKFDVEYNIFGDKTIFGKDTEKVDQMLKELTNLMNTIQKKLSIQEQVLKLRRSYRTQAKDAANLLEKISNMTELDALLQYTNYAADHLGRLNKQIQERYKQGKDAKWDLNVLQSYREIASSYDIVNRISGLANRYSDIFGDDNVRAIETACNKLQQAQRNILDACDTIGSKLYLNEILPYVGIVRYRIKNEERKKYIENNPKGPNESDKDFNLRVQQHIEQYLRDNSNDIEYQTREWLDAQRHVAESGFECNSILANFGTVYESKDPFVQAIVQRFDFAISDKEQRMIKLRAQISKVLKEYKAKYGTTNFSDLRKVFDDFAEVTDNGVIYLVNPIGGEYLQASKKERNRIFSDGSLTFQEQQAAWEEWLRTNNPIFDIEGYNRQMDEDLASILEPLDEEKRKKVIQNAKLSADKRKSWFSMYKDGTITADIRQELDDLTRDLDEKYRKPNPAIYKNAKYVEMLKYKDSNDPKWQLYKLFLDLIKTYDYSMPRSLRLNFRLPSVIKRGVERVNSDGVTSTIKNYLQTEMLPMQDDDIRGTFVDENGKRIRQIPMYYYAEGIITEDEQSFDLPTIFYKWADAADTYLVKRDLESLILQTQALLASRETQDNVISLLKGNKNKVSSHKVNTQNQFDSWVDQVFYGNRVQDMGKIKLPYSDKVIDTAKLIKWIVGMSNKRVMSGNMVAALNNILVGEVNQLEEAVAGQHTTKEDYARATKEFAKNFYGLLADVNKAVPQNKLNQLAEWFGIFESNKNLSLEGFMRHSVSDILYTPNKMGEHEMQIRFLTACLMTMKAKDDNGKVIGSMYDYVTFDENNQLVVDDKVANFDKMQQNLFSLKVRKVLISLHGNYSDRASVAAESQWYGWIGLSLRRWIEPTVMRRYQKRYYDSVFDTEIGGMHRDFASWLFRNEYTAGMINFFATNIFKAKQLQIEVMKWSTMTDDEKRNVIKSAIEFSVAALSYAIFALINPGDDDDHDFGQEILWVIKYQAYRLFTDMTFYVLPTSFTKLFQDPFPVMSYINDILKLFMQMFDPFEEYSTGKHLVSNKLLDQAIRLTPGAKQLGRIGNASQEINNFLHQR